MTESEVKIDKLPDGSLRLSLAGEWKQGRVLTSPVTKVDEIVAELAAEKAPRLAFDTSRLGAWDSLLPAFVSKLLDACRRNEVAVDPAGLPAGVRKLMALAAPEKQRSVMTAEEARAAIARVGMGIPGAEDPHPPPVLDP